MKNLSVVILNFNRPLNVKNYIIPHLEKNSLVDEIIISHGKEKTAFNENTGKVKNLQHWGKINKEYGLARRFLSAVESKNEHIIIMDDDIIPSHSTIKKLKGSIEKEENIYGLYGRDIDNKDQYLKDNTFGAVPIVLTRCLITTKTMCQYFLAKFRSYESDLVSKSKPYWNGEDILFNLLAIKKYNKLPQSLDLEHDNFISDYFSFQGISFESNHDKYRKLLSKELIDKLNISNKIREERKIESFKNDFVYFVQNSILLYPIIILLSALLIYMTFIIYCKIK